ncbi:thermonuclease family protein [Microvirga terricola]|uniref:DNA-binding protein n=1 Tax=Microvirga terricola TaxID=2719797 RepID=A0ABX0V7N8_9HYPH|nr:thermonuclease family protein [Microvirga terricola]NIX75206.1 DNA-binding protein [Microvirga terricola]
MRIFGLGLAAALALAPAMAPLPALSQTACGGQTEPDRLQALTPQGDLVLASGRIAKLSAIRLPDAPERREEVLVWLRGRMGEDVQVRSRPGLDRWNRLLAQISLPHESNPSDLAEKLVGSGLVLVDPGADETFCQSQLLHFEAKARELSLGLWRDDRYKPIQSDQTDRLRERIGNFALVEGRVRSVGERAQRTYLNFGGHWAEDFTIVIPKKTWKLMAERGLDAAALRGKTIRARGILEPWQGTSLTITVPEMIERLAGERPPR